MMQASPANTDRNVIKVVADVSIVIIVTIAT